LRSRLGDRSATKGRLAKSDKGIQERYTSQFEEEKDHCECLFFQLCWEKYLWLSMMDECPMLCCKHGHIKSQKVTSTAIARCDVNEVKEKNNYHKGVKHAEIQPQWCLAGSSNTQRRRIQHKRLMEKQKVVVDKKQKSEDKPIIEFCDKWFESFSHWPWKHNGESTSEGVNQ
jgi:hypothetical protein